MLTPLRYDSGKITTVKSGTALNTTIVKYDALDWSSGYLTPATSGTTEVRFIAMEDIVTGAVTHLDIQVLCVDGVEFECDCTDATAVTQRGTYVDLTDHDTLNNGASSTDVFYVTEMIGATTDKKVRGYFVHNIS
jgi:hypothetical protein